MPQISIIIPVYNGATTIQATIDSVLAQTFSDFELIIVDDGSTDDTLKIISQYGDPRIQVVSSSHAGAAATRNRGLKQASGEYIAFLDADDLWTPDKLEAQLNALQTHLEAAVAYSWTDFIDEAGSWRQAGRHRTVNGEAYAAMLLYNFIESGSNPLIRRDALNTVGGFDESLTGGQDWDLYLRLAARYLFVNVPKVQILYRIRDNSISANITRQEQQVVKVLNKAFSQAPKNLQPLKRKSLALVYKYLACRILEQAPSRLNGWKGLRLIGIYTWYEPQLWEQLKLILILLFKSIALIVLPQSLKLLQKFKLTTP
ncbi:glycosyltransferase family 2 protein [Limnoraphis robusta]|uniref:Glycosyl transferase family A n=1 Tax=Limnoraphis robusta CS-951 TaxID=1637645 RepID=A0A0F5YKP0_9CYAN|nr:glycosyltransferase [Limnoraphis robusta]KKD39484.1 glycosyl transferase family A [Limnoraphis robusta CS-951]